jgi:peptidoglycan/xylan/chitin deacetylase (PgdA/CDA1 family)
MPKRKRLTVFFILLSVAGLVSLNIFFRQNYVVPILMYHSVSDSAKNAVTVSPKTFARQMSFLKKFKYNVIPLAELAELVRLKKKIPGRTVAITFDDGYKDNYTNALPLLKKHGLPATFFVIIEEIDRPQGDRLDWEEISQMRSLGFEIGSHTLGPEPLVDIRQEPEVRRQIFESKKILEDKIGGEVRIFSYPGGFFTPQIRQLVMAAGYKAAAATNPGRDYPDNDIYALKRLRISENAGNLAVFAFEISGIYTFFKEHRRKNH